MVRAGRDGVPWQQLRAQREQRGQVLAVPLSLGPRVVSQQVRRQQVRCWEVCGLLGPQ